MNQWHDKLIAKGMPVSAESLLKVMLPDIEDILAEWGRASVPDRYRRAQLVLQDVRQTEGGTGRFGERNRLLHQEETLRQFMSVQKTVWILEDKPL